jgi:hypothetical protein
MSEARALQSSLSLLKALPEFEPPARVWEKIERQLPRREPPALRFWLRAAAAASLVVALLSFAVVATMPRAGALPVVEGGRALNWNEPFHAAQFARIAVPDVGTLRIDENTTLRFTDSRHVTLESGQVFADILPSGAGFEIKTPESTVRVHGTRFGVTTPSTVYVVEGRVEVNSPRGRLTVGPDQVAVGTAFVSVSPAEHLRWLAEHERPVVRLTLDPRDQTAITPGSPLKWRLILETDALAPLYLAPPRDGSQFFALLINGTSVSLDPNRAELREAAPGPNGLVRLDVSHRCVIECAVDPGLFREKGRAQARAVLTSGVNAPERAWIGIAQSDLVTVEVR